MASFVAVTELVNTTGASASGSVSSTASNALIGLGYDFRYNSGGAVTADSAMAVTGGGSWTDHGLASSTSGVPISLSVAGSSTPSATGGTQTITATFSGGAGAFVGCALFVHEFSGMATSSMLDSIDTTGAHATSTTITTPAKTNANASDVFFAVFETESTGTETLATTGSGWLSPTGSTDGAGTSVTGGTAYKIVSTSASQTETWSNSESVPYEATIMCFKQAAGVIPPGLGPSLEMNIATASAQSAMMR